MRVRCNLIQLITKAWTEWSPQSTSLKFNDHSGVSDELRSVAGTRASEATRFTLDGGV